MSSGPDLDGDPDQDGGPVGVEDDELLTGEAVALDLHPTGFALRAAGAIIDFVAHTVLYVLVLLGLFWAGSTIGLEDAVFFALGIVALVLCFVLVPMVVEAGTRGRSLGKLAIGGRIVRDDGGAIGLRHAGIRALAGFFEFPMTLGGVAALFGLLAPRTKRLGDLLAGTYCQYERYSGRVAPIFGVPIPLASWSRIADVARMPDPLARRISQFLTNAPQFEPSRRAYLARQLASEASAYVSPLPRIDPELFLAGVVVVRREREAESLELERRRLERLAPALRGIPHDFPLRTDGPQTPL